MLNILKFLGMIPIALVITSLSGIIVGAVMWMCLGVLSGAWALISNDSFDGSVYIHETSVTTIAWCVRLFVVVGTPLFIYAWHKGLLKDLD